MNQRWVARLTVAVSAALAVLAAATPARADSTATLNQSGVFADTSKFGTCVEKPDQSPTESIWVFVWPGNNAGSLVDLSLSFDTNGDGVADAFRDEDDATKTADSGTLKVWVSTPAGWKLLTGTSTITGSVPQNQFQLTHSCGGTGTTATPSPKPSTSAPGPSSPASPQPSTSTGGEPGGGGNGDGDGGGLPLTGASVLGTVGLGLLLLVAGIVLVAVRRRPIRLETPRD